MFFAARFGMRKYTARNAGRKAKRNTELEKTIGQRFHSVRQTLCMIAEKHSDLNVAYSAGVSLSGTAVRSGILDQQSSEILL